MGSTEPIFLSTVFAYGALPLTCLDIVGFVMSLILALDTSTDACSVALNANGMVTSKFELASKSHTQRLLPMVDELLQANGLALTDLDAIAFGRGPGSFTGLRICAGIVQGLAFGANLPVIPVSTLEAMALGYYRAHPDIETPVMVALDARMDEVYWGMFTRREGLVEALADELVIAPEALGEHLRASALPEQFLPIGPGWHYPGMQSLAFEAAVLAIYPHAENIALLAEPRFLQGQGISAFDAQPVYLRDSVSWQKRQRIRAPGSMAG